MDFIFLLHDSENNLLVSIPSREESTNTYVLLVGLV